MVRLATSVRQSALMMFIDNTPYLEIARRLDINPVTIKQWQAKYGWKEIKSKAIADASAQAPEKFVEIINSQASIAVLAHKELLERLERQDITREQVNLLALQLKDNVTKRRRPETTAEEKAELKKETKLLMQTINALRGDLFDNNELISIERHSLELARPKSVSNLNLTQNNSIGFENSEQLMAYLKERHDNQVVSSITVEENDK